MDMLIENALHKHILQQMNHYTRQMGSGYVLYDDHPVSVGAIGYLINGHIVTLPYHSMNAGKGISEIRPILDSSNMKRVGQDPITVTVGLPIDVVFPDKPHKFIDRVTAFNLNTVTHGYPGMTILAMTLFVDEHEDCNVFQKDIPQTILLYDRTCMP